MRKEPGNSRSVKPTLWYPQFHASLPPQRIGTKGRLRLMIFYRIEHSDTFFWTRFETLSTLSTLSSGIFPVRLLKICFTECCGPHG